MSAVRYEIQCLILAPTGAAAGCPLPLHLAWELYLTTIAWCYSSIQCVQLEAWMQISMPTRLWVQYVVIGQVSMYNTEIPATISGYLVHLHRLWLVG